MYVKVDITLDKSSGCGKSLGIHCLICKSGHYNCSSKMLGIHCLIHLIMGTTLDKSSGSGKTLGIQFDTCISGHYT